MNDQIKTRQQLMNELEALRLEVSELKASKDRLEQTEEALRESQQFLQLVMDNIPQAIFWKDRNLVYLGCNRIFALDAGINNPSEIVGLTDYQLAWKEEEADFFRECDRRIMKSNRAEFHIIEPQLQAEGKQAWLDTNKIPLHDSKGNVQGILGTYEDITERKLMEELLAGERMILEMVATGQPLQQTLDALARMIEQVGTDCSSAILICDKDRARLLCASAPSLPEEYVKRTDGLKIEPCADFCSSAAYWDRTISAGESPTGYPWADLNQIAQECGLTECCAAPIQGPKGEVLGAFGLYSTRSGPSSKKHLLLVETAAHIAGIAIERKRSEEALRESEEKFRMLFETSRDSIYIRNRQGRFFEVNRATTELFGYTRQEMLKKINVNDLYANPEDQLRFAREIETKGSVRDYELRLRKKDGTEMDCLLTATLRRSKDGSVEGYQGIIRDVTDYKLAQDALQQSEARYRAIVEDQTELICRFRPDGTITFANEAYCRYFQKTREELIDHSFMPFIPAEDQPGVESLFRSLCKENPVATHEHRVIAPGGEVRWQQWTNRIVMDVDGKFLEFQAVGRDVTERKLMEEALRDSAEKTKLFAYSVAHDLKSPAIGVYGLSNLLRKNYGDVLDEKGKNYCEQILRASEHVAALVEKINVFIKTKETPLTIEEINIERILGIVKEEFSVQLSLRQVDWVQPDALPTIRADRLSLIRIFRNLVDNALKYAGEPLSEIRIGYEESEADHVLSVTDNGIGVPQCDFEKLFGFFQRRETVAGIEGTGLGLAIVKEIVEQHGGKVWIESIPEQGTTFYLSIAKNL